MFLKLISTGIRYLLFPLYISISFSSYLYTIFGFAYAHLCFRFFIYLMLFTVYHLQVVDIYVIVSIMFRQALDFVLSVNMTCTITKFQVQLNDLMFKASDHKYLLKFIGGTTLGDNNKHEIPDKVIKFASFVDIISGKWKKNILIGLVFFHFFLY